MHARYVPFYILTPRKIPVLTEKRTFDVAFSHEEFHDFLEAQGGAYTEETLDRQGLIKRKDSDGNKHFEAKVPRAKDEHISPLDRQTIEKSTKEAIQDLYVNRNFYSIFSEFSEAKFAAEKSFSTACSSDGFSTPTVTVETATYCTSQPGVIEVLVDTTKAEQKRDSSDKVFIEPQHYLIKRAWVGQQQVELGSYSDIFERNLKEGVINQVSALFHDYYSPSFFSCHWRHHKALAREITNDLRRMQYNPEEAYHYLFQQRSALMVSGKVEMTGSFMRRMDAALRLINQAILDHPLDEQPVAARLASKP